VFIMIKIFGFPTQNTKKVLYVAEELNVDYEFDFVDLTKGEQKSKEFSQKTPIGKVPVLQHDGRHLFESGAICCYLAEVQDSPLYPIDKFARALVNQWMDFFNNHLGRWFNSLYFNKIIRPKYGMGEPDPKELAEAVEFANQQCEKVDAHLGANKYLTGPNLTIADLFAFASVEQTAAIDFSLEPYPNLKSWMEKIGKRDSIARALQRLQ